MIIIFIVLLLCMCWRMKFCFVNAQYMSINQTAAWKGVFAIVILASHTKHYITLGPSFYDTSFVYLLSLIGQLMVAPYFFYSGYGIMHGIIHKPDYLKGFFKKRIFKVLLHFDVAVLLYIILMSAIGRIYPPHYYLTCWVGWDSVGNSNWFIFVILVAYLIAYISMTVLKQTIVTKPLLIVAVVTILTASFGIVLKLIGRESYWFNTVLAFPFGMAFYWFKTKIIDLLPPPKQHRIYLGLIFGSLCVFACWYCFKGIDDYGISACLFCLVLTMMSLVVRMSNPILSWLGQQAFAIYIMQRFSMNLLRHWGLNAHPYLFAALSIVAALIVASLFTKLLNVLDRRLSM